jgi:hypothetical protein
LTRQNAKTPNEVPRSSTPQRLTAVFLCGVSARERRRYYGGAQNLDENGRECRKNSTSPYFAVPRSFEKSLQQSPSAAPSARLDHSAGRPAPPRIARPQSRRGSRRTPRRQAALFTHRRHQPLGEMAPSTSLQPLGETKFEQSSQSWPFFGDG